MQISELAKRSGVTVKAVRYYEGLGLIAPNRLRNGYRDYNEGHVRICVEIRELAATGITARRAAPFVECLQLGHEHGDDCVGSLVAYRDGIAEIDRMLAKLHIRRAELAARLHAGANRTQTKDDTVNDYSMLPEGLPVPADDGAADHLPGTTVPSLHLRSTDGQTTDLGNLGSERAVLYFYPLTGRPGVDLPDGWDAIPGARGCTTEACDFRDHHDELRAAGVATVFGVSNQEPDYQREVVERLRLPFTMLSDPRFRVAEALALPTFSAPGHARLYSRLTLIVRDGKVEHVFYPIFPPNTHAQQVLEWLRANPA